MLLAASYTAVHFLKEDVNSYKWLRPCTRVHVSEEPGALRPALPHARLRVCVSLPSRSSSSLIVA